MRHIGSEVQASCAICSLARACMQVVEQAVWSEATCVHVSLNAVEPGVTVEDDGKVNFSAEHLKGWGEPGTARSEMYTSQQDLLVQSRLLSLS